ncbi:MAG TPA: FmdB family zinc ribbon protein [Armatimonadota bacterium]|jgi:putative FmdB family regulatory protein
MPTYEYQCKNCDNRFEVVQRMTEEPLKNCDSCGGEVRRVLFPTGIIFKGSGFHINDYRKPSEKAKEKAASCPVAQEKGGGTEACATCPK